MSKHEQAEHRHHEHCTCGHNHDEPAQHHGHRHKHGDSCECGQEERVALGTVRVESHLHDEARVISGSLTLYADYGVLKTALSNQLEFLAKAVFECGGIVGHIKASCESKQVEMFSVTDVTVSVKAAPGQEIKINLAAIVFGIDPDEAEKLVTNTLEAVKAGV